MERVMGDKKAILIFMFPAILIFTVVVPVPIIKSIYYGFFEWNILNEKKFVIFLNYTKLFQDEIFIKSILNTFIITVLSLIVQIGMALVLSVFITRITKKLIRNVYQSAFFIPNVLSSSVIGILWFYVFNYEFGLINNFFRTIGLEKLSLNWIGEPKTVLYALVIVTSWQWVGYHMILYMTAIFNIPQDILEAAKVDGITEIRMVRSIIIPMIWPIMKVSIILIVIGSLKYFDMAWIMTEGGPDHASETMATFLYREAFNKMRYGYASAAATILFILCILTSLVMNKYMSRKNKVY